ncbi:MAG: cysteine desulfurase family protein [Candidatus Bathyarchaeia archaeon]|jgi:cysteine desulfurase|nr:cysteine desulfurase [Candidatus Bathyarchaeota archaeon A05DMB-4]MDH7595706.1 cysteine desulfurase family protein [Candidatus Bathyarchaeota archaeon]
MRRVYVDYAATTPVDPRVFEAMKPFFMESFGNASSVNTSGVTARKAIEEARAKIAQFMNADSPEELIFTGSATESNNLVLKGYAFKHGKAKTHIAVSTIEHDCILNAAKWLKQMGYKVDFIPVDQYGLIDMNVLERAIKAGANLVSVIHGNNEIGTIEPIQEISELCHENNAIFHTDAAQSFGKVPIDVKRMGIDMMTINAHKLYGPKGVGALYIRKGIELDPLLHGGGHEFGLRSSTENVPGIVGFAKAVELRKDEMKPEAGRLTRLRDKLIKGTLEIPDSHLNGHPTKRLPNNANFRFAYIEGEAIVLGLDMEGIEASSGSACASKTELPSHVLLAIGLKPEEARGSLRISLGKYNTPEDIDYILQVLPKVVGRLREMSPLYTKASQKQ